MKYIGPFLRLNSLNEENLRNQLFYLAKESTKILVLTSKCGITIPVKELKLKNISSDNTSYFDTFSPLLCIYKKASCKLTTLKDKLCFDEEKFKKEIEVSANAYMTLSLLELSEYYCKSSNQALNDLGNMYLKLSKKQLEFYASFLRNEEGVFVDKIDTSDALSDKYTFENKGKNFKFSDQALLMAAFYKCSILCNDKDSTLMSNFSLDIFKMFEEFKEEMYSLSCEELLNLCVGFNIYYKYSQNDSAKSILLDIYEYIWEKYINEIMEKGDIYLISLLGINSTFIYQNTNYIKYKDNICKINKKLLDKFDADKGIFIKNITVKENEYASEEVLLYLINLLLSSKIDDENVDLGNVCLDIFRHQVIDGGLILSWPDAPSLDNAERYRGFSLKSEDLIDEQNYKIITIPAPEANELAPLFVKRTIYNMKRDKFTHSKPSFESKKNMFIFYLLLKTI